MLHMDLLKEAKENLKSVANDYCIHSYVEFTYYSVEPCQSSPLECITGICCSNQTGCRITGTYFFNFTNSRTYATTTECVYSPTSSLLVADTLAVNLFFALMMVLLGAASFCFMFKCLCKRQAMIPILYSRDIGRGVSGNPLNF